MSPRAARRSLLLILLGAAVAAAGPALARQAAPAPRALTAADYARAEKMLGATTNALVFKTSVRPNWLPDGRFWYTNTNADGTTTTVVVNPATGTRTPCGAATPECRGLPAATTPEPGRGGGRGAGAGGGGAATPPSVLSPDGTRAAFVRDHNLWVRDVATGRERALTTDGVKDYGYATNNAGWTKSDTPVLLWSPDSKKIATFQHDGRQVGEMYLVNTVVGHPTLQAWKYPLAGDAHIFTIERVIVDVDAARLVRLKMPPDPHRSTLCDHIVCGGSWVDVEWYPDASRLAFVSSSRDHKEATLRVADAATGDVRDVYTERVATFYESGNGRVNWRVLPATNEFLWFSQKTDWGQLYLHDLATGRLKHQITSGNGNVTQLLRVDEQARVLYFMGVGKEPERDPYFRHLYRVGMDGTGQALISPGNGDHTISWSPDWRYFVDTFSTPAVAPVTELRDRTGRLVVALERADISKLEASGWKPPVPITVKARDGATDLYGLLYRPTTFDANRKYPIVNRIYPGPQTGSVGSRTFAAARSDSQALAELGFIVVEIDGMGTPWRSKSFHETYYGNMADNTLPDQIAGMRELARRFPWIDLDRAGIWGHSGGGYAAAAALFHYPEFFKVGVSQSGNHDNRQYEDDWAEKWHGLLEKKPGGESNYDSQANQNFAHKLQGRLLLAHGTLDSNVPPDNTLLVVDALIRANKDFELIMFPNAGHGYGTGAAGNYMIRRRWDYFVRHLLGAEPPKDYTIGTPRTSG